MSDNDWADPRVQKRVADDVCARCRKPLLRGHRIVWALIVVDPHAYNPVRITEKGLELGLDFEYAHVNCKDPFLDGKIIV